MRRIIHSMGRNDWQLALCGNDVTASIHSPTVDSVIITTADFGFTSRDRGKDNRSQEQVVAAYRKRTRCEESFDELLKRVREAIDNPTKADTPEVAA